MTTQKSAADVEREVEASREELERTVEALKDKMTPGELFNEASRAMGGAGNRMMMKVVDQAKENPVPVALIGLGLAWLMASQSKKSHGYAGAYGAGYGVDYYDDASHGASVKDKVTDRAHAVADKASGVVASAKDRLSHTAAGAREHTRSAMDGVSSAAGQVRERASQMGHRVKQQATDTFESEPLLLGALGLAVGLAIGAALPATAAESRYMGPARDKLMGKGKDLARDQIDTAKGVAQAAYGRVKEELQRPETEGDLPTRVGEAARAGAQAVREGLHDQAANGAGTTH
ncbi:DUF3618 domain-containing protein [Phenylobacterium sp.]|uniref:DUF3618 domain-containing protein n=2 Tax=Phenylobacterium sp. TaxID=1871053 RepID=UPI002B5B0B5B|nr:DUF3618 domain-containing protein [Phenylobacterium sp.]HVI33805.1 DUF3618 domain-containing protein [Phenylobacterium sp.]